MKIIIILSSFLIIAISILCPLFFFWVYFLPINVQVKLLRPIQLAWCWLIIKLFNIKLISELNNKNNTKNSLLILANHKSFLDIFIILYLFRCGFIIKSSLMFTPFGWNSKFSGSITLSRTSINSFLKVMKICKQRIKQKISICLFPEGTRSKSESILPFKRGLLNFYYRQKIQVLILAHYGTQSIIPVNSFLPTVGKKIAVYAKDILDPNNYDNSKEFSTDCYNKMQFAQLKAKKLYENYKF